MTTIQQASKTASRSARVAIRPVLQAHNLNAARAARYDAAVSDVLGNLRGKKLLPAAIRAHRNDADKARSELLQHRRANFEEAYDPDEHVYIATNTDPEGEDEIKGRISNLEDKAADLEQNGQEPRREKRKGGVRNPKVETFEREQKVGVRPTWSRRGGAKLDRELAAEGDSHVLTSELGIKNRQDLDEVLSGPHGKAIADQYKLKYYGLKLAPKTIKTTVKNSQRIQPDYKVRIEGYPNNEGRSRLADDLRSRIFRRRGEWLTAEDARAQARVKAARRIADVAARSPLRRLAIVRNPRIRAAALAGGAILGGWSGWKMHEAVKKLAKADEPEIPLTAAELHRAGVSVESTLAPRIARVLGDVKDDSAGELLSARQGSLMTTALTGLQHALRPIDEASRAGIQAPIPAELHEDDGGPRNVVFTLNARSPRVEDYIRDYRQNRITALVKDQQDAIKSILIDAAKQGMSPYNLAARVRQTIGLTPDQAQHVLNYQAELEDLNPGALNRSLRDKRYDRVIQRAIDENSPLSGGQIQRMTDAYHRKYLAYRAMTIARTEGVGAANNGHIAAVEDLLDDHPGYTVIKTWIATEDERTRPDHIGLHGKSVVGLYTPFVTESGDYVKWPHDQDAPAKQVVNCRCSCSCRLVPRTVAAQLGAKSVSPIAETEDA